MPDKVSPWLTRSCLFSFSHLLKQVNAHNTLNIAKVDIISPVYSLSAELEQYLPVSFISCFLFLLNSKRKKEMEPETSYVYIFLLEQLISILCFDYKA